MIKIIIKKMSFKRARTMSFDPYYVGSQASQIGYAPASRGGYSRKRKTMKKTAKKDKALATKAYVKRVLDSRIEDKEQNFDNVIDFAGYFFILVWMLCT